MNPDELRAPETDEPTVAELAYWAATGRRPKRDGDRRPVIYTVALLAGLTLAAIAWRLLR